MNNIFVLLLIHETSYQLIFSIKGILKLSRYQLVCVFHTIMNLWLGGVLILFILSYVNCGSLPVSSSLNEPQSDSDGTQSDTNEDIVPKSDEIERKVSYDGVQVWHIKTDDSVKQETVNHLKAKFGLLITTLNFWCKIFVTIDY